ncbi:hypothetical protein ACOSP7_001440 [Xanthoceras sorbifolium]
MAGELGELGCKLVIGWTKLVNSFLIFRDYVFPFFVYIFIVCIHGIKKKKIHYFLSKSLWYQSFSQFEIFFPAATIVLAAYSGSSLLFSVVFFFQQFSLLIPAARI